MREGNGRGKTARKRIEGVAVAKEPVIEDIVVGAGRPADRRDIVEIGLTMRLARGDVVIADAVQAFQIGARQVVAGLEQGVLGMRAGGRRHISFGPHLGYGGRNVGTIPADAKLQCDVELLALHAEDDPGGPAGIRRMGRKTSAS